MSFVLWLDDLRNPFDKEWRFWRLRNSPIPDIGQYKVIWVKSFADFSREISQNGLPICIFFDHDLGSDIAHEKVRNGMSKRQARKEKKGTKSGLDCANWLIEYCRDNKLSLPPYAIQSANELGKQNIDNLLKSKK